MCLNYRWQHSNISTRQIVLYTAWCSTVTCIIMHSLVILVLFMLLLKCTLLCGGGGMGMGTELQWCVNRSLDVLHVNLHWASKETSQFMATLTKIHRIKINHRWTQIYALVIRIIERHLYKKQSLPVPKRRKMLWNLRECVLKSHRNGSLSPFTEGAFSEY